MNGQPVRAVAYYRMSTDKQEDSIDRQRSQVEPHAARHGYVIVRDYVDEGIAGDEFDRRPAFQQLLKDARNNLFDVILADELTRLSRQEVIDFIAKVVHPLKEAGVRVETVAEGAQGWDDVVQIITLAIRQDKSSSESPKLARRVLTKQLMLADRHGYLGGPPPYGYQLADDPVRGKRLVPDPVKAEHVRLIFRMIDEGHTLGSVREELYRRGVCSPSGKPKWSRTGLYKVLRNRKYVGDYKWGEQAAGKHVRQGGGQVRGRRKGESRYGANPPAEWVIRPDSHEPLVSRDQYERVQARLKGNRKRTTPHVGGGGFVLNRLLVCGHCGSHMLGTTSGGRRLYCCGGYVSYGAPYCHKNSFAEAPFVRFLVRKLREVFLSSDSLQKLRDEVRRQDEAERDPARLGRLRAKAQELAAKIDRGTENLAFLSRDRIPGVEAKLREWEREREAILRELFELERVSQVDVLEQQIAAAEAFLWRLQEALTDDDTAALRELLRELVVKVELFWTHWKTPCRSRSRFERGVIYARPGNVGLGGQRASGIDSTRARVAHPVDAKLMNCDFPPGSPLSKKT
jgi:site-specific DNA recombinase